MFVQTMIGQGIVNNTLCIGNTATTKNGGAMALFSISSLNVMSSNFSGNSAAVGQVRESW